MCVSTQCEATAHLHSSRSVYIRKYVCYVHRKIVLKEEDTVHKSRKTCPRLFKTSEIACEIYRYSSSV